MNSLIQYVRLLALLSILFVSGIASADDATKPNVVFLLVDDLGWGDFGCYGADFYETPNIDQLASEGMKFQNAYAACTVCSPSRAAILSGCYPARLKLTDWITGHKRPRAKLNVPDWKMSLDHDRILLPEALKEAGYSTGFFGKWHLMPKGADNFDQHYPTHHGFDLNVGGREWGQPAGPGRYFSPFDMPNLDDGKPGDYLTDKLTDAAIDFLDNRDPAKPFLLYFSYYTLHGPLMCPPELKAKYAKKAKTFQNEKNEHLDARRAGMVECLDNSVGRIMQKLESLGLAENTVVILTGDNGGNFDENSGGLKHCKGFSHEGGVREPTTVRWPGKIAAGTECDEVIIGTDFYPTILEMAALQPRPDQHQDGVSIVPLLTGEADGLDREAVYWHYPHYHRTKPYGAVREGDWKLIEFYEDGKLELYNLKVDQNETENVADSETATAQRLLEKLSQWRVSVDAQMMTDNPNWDRTHKDETTTKRRY